MTACCGFGFHWGQAAHRKIQKLSLYTDLAKINSAKKLLEEVWALQFIPAERIRVVLTKFGTKSEFGPYRELCDYITTQWC